MAIPQAAHFCTKLSLVRGDHYCHDSFTPEALHLSTVMEISIGCPQLFHGTANSIRKELAVETLCCFIIIGCRGGNHWGRLVDVDYEHQWAKDAPLWDMDTAGSTLRLQLLNLVPDKFTFLFSQHNSAIFKIISSCLVSLMNLVSIHWTGIVDWRLVME